MAKVPEVPAGVWKGLYAAAGRFHELKPWEYFDDATLFGVRNPEGGQTGYGCILGALGQVLALCLYRGAEGLDFHLKAQKGKVDFKQGGLLSMQNCLMAEFTGKRELQKEDLAVIKELGLSFRGGHAWPVFSSYLPGHTPWFLTEAEARFLTLALDCACDAVSQTLAGRLNLDSHPGKCLVYLPKAGAGGRPEIETRWEALPKHQPAPPASYVPDMAKINKIVSAGLPDNGPWEADVFDSGMVIGDKDRPYIPKMIIVAHQASGFMFHASVVEAGLDEVQALGDAIVGAMLEHSFAAAIIYVKAEETAAALAPLGKALGLVFERKNRLQSIIGARKALAAATRGRGFIP